MLCIFEKRKKKGKAVSAIESTIHLSFRSSKSCLVQPSFFFFKCNHCPACAVQIYSSHLHGLESSVLELMQWAPRFPNDRIDDVMFLPTLWQRSETHLQFFCFHRTVVRPSSQQMPLTSSPRPLTSSPRPPLTHRRAATSALLTVNKPACACGLIGFSGCFLTQWLFNSIAWKYQALKNVGSAKQSKKFVIRQH